MTLPPEYFDGVYAASPDPWGFDDRWYEERKRALVLAALPRRRFRRAVEPGCSTGRLTVELAGRCDEVRAFDVSRAALATARERLAGAPHVHLQQGALPGTWPDGAADLVLLSEVGYYLSEADLRRAAGRAAGALSADGVLLACHWRHPVADYPLPGDRVHEVLAEIARSAGLHRLGGWLDEDVRLDVWTREAAGVARQEGLVG